MTAKTLRRSGPNGEAPLDPEPKSASRKNSGRKVRASRKLDPSGFEQLDLWGYELDTDEPKDNAADVSAPTASVEGRDGRASHHP